MVKHNEATNPSALIQSSLEKIARGDINSLSGLLSGVEVHAKIDSTKTVCHSYCVSLDGNGRPRTDALIEEICTHVLEYAIPRSRIREAMEEYQRTGTPRLFSRLEREARSLFTDIDNSGESGELLLYMLTEKFLRLPQLLCKMDLKTSTRMHFHGADGLHAGVDNQTGKLALYFGESKVHQSITGALADCFDSLGPILNSTGTLGEPGTRELQLLGRHMDLENPKLEEAIKSFLDPASPNFKELEFRGVCLVGFDFDKYPTTANTCTHDEFVKSIAPFLPKWKTTTGEKLKSANLLTFKIDLFCLPFPSVEAFRKEFKSRIELDNGSK